MFRNDYSEGAAPKVLEAISKVCSEQNAGYGEDKHCENAKRLIKDYFGVPDGDVAFLTGGTQTNMTVISYFLRPYEGVIACDTAHINVHETGAIEGSGHKIFICPNENGKLTAENAEKAILLHTDEHMIKPKMIYISDSTETGTVYTKAELTALRNVCDKYGLILYMDGARLAVALASGKSDADAKFIGSVCDVFYAGGTKNGLLYGEAVVFANKKSAGFFRYHIKNKGAMLAKCFVAGAQFEALFTDNLYTGLARNSIDTANYIKEALQKKGVVFEGKSVTNQLFVRLEKAKAEAVCESFGCEKWTDMGNEWIIRIVTSFATAYDECDRLIESFE